MKPIWHEEERQLGKYYQTKMQQGSHLPRQGRSCITAVFQTLLFDNQQP